MEKLKSSLKNNNFKNILRNIIWLSGEKGVRFFIGLYTASLMARHLGTTQFGELNYYIAFFGLLSPLAYLGLDGIIVNKLVHSISTEEKQKILNSSFTLKFIGSVFAFLVGAILITTTQNLYETSSILLGLYLIFQSFDSIEFWYQSQTNSKILVTPKLIAFLTANATRIFFITLKLDYKYFCYSIILEFALNAFAIFFQFRFLSTFHLKLTSNFVMFKELLKESHPAILSSFAIILYMKIDQVMIKQLSNASELGIYSAALRFSEIWYHLPIIISAMTTPTLLKKIRNNYHSFEKNFLILLKSLIFISLFISIIVSIFAKNIILMSFGQTYINAANILKIHIWASIFVFIGVASQFYYIEKKLLKITMYQTWIGAVVNIILNFILIPKMGPSGAAISTLISYALSSLFLNAAWKETRILFSLQIRSLFFIK